ncbi:MULTISPECIES: RDD family protein [Brachybacterium]|uniref:RDD family protein n=2 Tax=Brachybacterium TaxID=43668 RepID=A0A426SI16_9MICO|nr:MULTISPECIES: RDD family protein [Brachybacterium]RRR17785.1 RDD family protein [Brachybacterium paraconglomeratum]GLI30888.1 RDD family protein [Brachybacterium conglomeratum]GLK05783.1 RDD family protein [Brachybacterium conglomeratum]
MALSGTAAAVSPSSRRDALITGDAVLLDLRTASFATRIVSAVIDGVLQLALLIGGILSIAWFADRAALDDGFLAAGVLLASVLAYVGYPVLSELLLRGRSVGRLVMGTRVVRDDGGPVHVRQSVLRAVMAMFEIWSTTGAVALVCSVIDRRSRRIGDLLAGTMVIQERMRTHPPQRIEVPLSLRDWAQAADVGRLPLPLLQDIRAFLPRAGQINAESRHQLSRDLLRRTLPHVAPAPPPGTPPEEFLAAVLAERSRRDEMRLRRAQERQQELAAEVRAVPFSA